MFSASEMIVIGVLALILIGPKQLPEVARSLGKLIADLKRTANGFTTEFKGEMNREMEKNNLSAKPLAPKAPEKFVLRYEDGTPMRPEDREPEAIVETVPTAAKKDEPT